MAKFHITKKGEPGICKAREGNCPLGAETDHFSSREEATAAFEALQKDKIFPNLQYSTTYSNITEKQFTADKKLEGGPNDFKGVIPGEEYFIEKYTNFNRARKVNVGEFAEANSGLAPLLGSKTFGYVDDFGAKKVVTAIDFGEVLVTKDGEVSTSDGKTFTVNKKSIAALAEDLNAELKAKTADVHEAAAQVWSKLGLEDFPKAPATQKSDFYVIVDGERKGVSVKSFVGAPPTLANSSGANSVTVKLFTDLTPRRARNLAEKINAESSASKRLGLLREANVAHVPSAAELPEVFSQNIDVIAQAENCNSEQLKKDYASAVTRFYLGDRTLTDREKESLRTIAIHYSRGMNASVPYDPEENDVELFLLQNSDGTSELHTTHKSNMILVLDEASSTYRKNQLAKVSVVEEENKTYFSIPFSANFRTVPNNSTRATF